jgi:peptidylprolyl isomerase
MLEPAPAELTIIDDVVGDGAEATAGAVCKVHYLGVDYETGDEFDSSWVAVSRSSSRSAA